MDDRDRTDDAARAALSALMDGDLAAAEEACRAWRGDASARDDWHAYHLIGDLLRSDEHHCDPGRDASFVAQLRVRLAAEPTVLAPSPRPAPAARRLRAWMGPAAVAAGFVVVAGALVVTRFDAPDGAAGGQIALGAGMSPPGPPQVPAAGVTGPEQPTPLIRNSDLDRYLAAHRQNANTPVPGAARGALQNVSAIEPGR